ncbi:crotonase/enoyl-CoA hydratase family protein [Achromobacter sp. SD115]|uniref:crotonase/enoyl-CoA hydratase family protein n=1 Tax=Achromobacter sp. SD115 TaxID=2782011 RepID=UPI001A960F83|nr:crotonase/enoyl-CoA hydratase family protein [Achromobacter sp. SD115]MBO1015796.1 crotonase/enoyl-CoA hydratase family protein [Achromobacter sp. SD115]
MAFLQIERDGGIVVATMNQPETRNALTGNTAIEEIVQLCADIRQDAGVKVLILTAAGPIFSSGGNVKDMRRFFDDALTPERICEEYRQGIQRIPLALHGLDVPVICAVNGPAIGAGLDIACMCDIRIAADTATFAESFVRVGIVPGDGGAWLLPRAVGMARASEMAYTGEAISAQDALAFGLVSRVVPAAELLPTAKTLAAKIAANPGGAMRMTKRLLREGQQSSLASLLELSASYQALAHKTAEHREAVTAFIEKRAPRF